MASRKRLKNEQCPNCGAFLYQANYCPTCGQENDQRRVSFWQLIADTLSNYLAFDGRLFRTLSGVIFRPGQVAKDYRQGKRQRHMPPVRFYFLASLLLVFSLQINQEEVGLVRWKSSPELAESPAKADKESFSPTELRQSLATTTSSLEKIRVLGNYFEERPQASNEEVRQELALTNNFWNAFLVEQGRKIGGLNRGENDFNHSLMNRLFWILFFFVPVLGLLLKLIYIRRDFYYTEHLFFAFFQQAFFFLLLLFYLLFHLSNDLLPWLILVYGGHLLLALRGFYQQSWLKTILKFFMLNLFSLLSFVLFFLLAALVVFLLM